MCYYIMQVWNTIIAVRLDNDVVLDEWNAEVIIKTMKSRVLKIVSLL